MQDKNQGFPPALTHENLAAALKRAADAEDHLRREVASNQALLFEVENVASLAHSTIADRDATIANLQGQLVAHYETIKARDQTIADLQDDIQNWKDRVLSKSDGAWEG